MRGEIPTKQGSHRSSESNELGMVSFNMRVGHELFFEPCWSWNGSRIRCGGRPDTRFDRKREGARGQTPVRRTDAYACTARKDAPSRPARTDAHARRAYINACVRIVHITRIGFLYWWRLAGNSQRACVNIRSNACLPLMPDNGLLHHQCLAKDLL